MKFGMFYPVAVASEADLGKGLWGLDRARYDSAIQELREDQRRDDPADVEPGGHEAEHLAERALRRHRAHDHVA